MTRLLAPFCVKDVSAPKEIDGYDDLPVLERRLDLIAKEVVEAKSEERKHAVPTPLGILEDSVVDFSWRLICILSVM